MVHVTLSQRTNGCRQRTKTVMDRLGCGVARGSHALDWKLRKFKIDWILDKKIFLDPVDAET